MTRQMSLTCRQLVEDVTAYLENAVNPAQRIRIEEHVAACGNCSAYLSQILRVVALARESEQAATSDRALPLGMLDTLLIEYRRLRT